MSLKIAYQKVKKSLSEGSDLTYKTLYSENTSVSSERHLWIAVIHQAISDASRIEVLKELLVINRDSPQRLSAVQADLFEVERSLVWVTTPSADLTEVCCLAGIDVNAILDRREQHRAGKFAVSSSDLLLLASSY